MNKFREWYIKHDEKITWCIIGWLLMALVEAVRAGNLTSVIIDAGLIYFNYFLWKTRNN